MKLFLLFLALAILLESSVTTLPLVLLLILFLAVINRNNEVFLIAFSAGIFLDLLTLGRFGISSLYFTVFVFLIYTYQNKFEIETIHFIILFSFFGSLLYLFIQGTSSVVFQSLVSVVLLTCSFLAFKKYNKKAPKYV